MSATNRGAVRVEQDFYRTPQWCCDILASRIAKVASGFTWEDGPCFDVVDAGAGDGRIGATVAEALGQRLNDLWGIDINPRVPVIGIDRFNVWKQGSYSAWLAKFKHRTPTIFVSNPPFSLAETFVFETVEKMQNIDDSMAVFLLRMNWLSSKRRADWLNQHSPKRITVLAPRPSFRVTETIDKDGKKRKSTTDACEYAWVWWTKLPMRSFEVAVRPEKTKEEK